MSKVLLPVLMSCFVLAFSQNAASSRQLTSGDRICVPVMYATDRPLSNNFSDMDYTNDQMPDAGEGDTEDSLNYGIKTVKIFLPINCSFSDFDGNSFGCITLGPQDREPGPSLMKNFKLKRNEFFEQAKKFQEQSPDKSVILFVHGCCTPHDAALQRAACLSVWLKRPVIVYDWSSPKWDYLNWFWTKADYHKNEDHSEASERRFNAFADLLERNLRSPSLSIVAHSMGNRLLDKYLVKRASGAESDLGREQLNSVEFANADVNAKRAAGYCSTYSRATKKCRIYLDDKDEALAASRSTHSGNRLGSPHEDLILLKKSAPKNVELIDHAAISGKSHDLPFWLVTDLFLTGEISPGRKCKLRTAGGQLFEVVPISK